MSGIAIGTPINSRLGENPIYEQASISSADMAIMGEWFAHMLISFFSFPIKHRDETFFLRYLLISERRKVYLFQEKNLNQVCRFSADNGYIAPLLD